MLFEQQKSELRHIEESVKIMDYEIPICRRDGRGIEQS